MSAQQFFFSAIDHLGVVGRDIAALTSAYRRLGFSPTVPVPLMAEKDGAAVRLGQDSAHLIFANSYVELSAVTSKSPDHHLAPWLARREGLHILAFGSADAEASRTELTDAGFDVPPVQNASRHVEYGPNHGDARFCWFKVPDTVGDEGFLCVVEQRTPDLVFQPPDRGHPNGAVGVLGVVVCVQDADATRDRYVQLPGASSVEGHRIWFGRQFIDLYNNAALAHVYPGAADIAGPALAGFAIEVKDLAVTQTYLEEQGVTAFSSEAGGIHTSPGDGCGAMVAFQQT